MREQEEKRKRLFFQDVQKCSREQNLMEYPRRGKRINVRSVWNKAIHRLKAIRHTKCVKVKMCRLQSGLKEIAVSQF